MGDAEGSNISWDEATLAREERRLAAIIRAVAMVQAEAHRQGEATVVMLPVPGRRPEAWSLVIRVPK